MSDPATTQAPATTPATATPPEVQPVSADATPAPVPTWDEWMATQDEPVKQLVTSRFSALESTVKATRDERDDMKHQLKELSKAQAEGSDARKALDETISKLERAERRAAFLEDAVRPEIQCKNPRAAWTLASAQNLFDKHDRPDWNAIKAEAPELFGPLIANANAGTGTGKPIPSAKNMNNFIRVAAGRS
jgi:hypothetical protein